jgi:hypothetical protein
MPEPRMICMAMPEDPALQADIGRVRVRHGQMDFILRITIKSVCEVSAKDARIGTAGTMSGQLRKRVEQLTRKRFGDGPAPTVQELDALEAEIAAITNELTRARFDGFLKEPIGASKPIKPGP